MTDIHVMGEIAMLYWDTVIYFKYLLIYQLIQEYCGLEKS